MKPKSAGSLEKLAEKAARDAAEYIRYNPKSLWDVDSIENTILSALSEATAALEEKIKKDSEIRSTLEHVRFQAECWVNSGDIGSQYGKTMQFIVDLCDNVLLESANASTPTPVLQVSEETSLSDLGYNALELLSRACAHPFRWKEGHVRWNAVGDIFCIGSTSSIALCKALQIDPHEILKGVEKVGDKQPRTMAEKKD